MNPFKALLLGATILIFSNILFCQVNTTSFEFEYNNTKYNGAIESPNQKAIGMIVIVPGHGPTDFVVGAEYSELRSFFKRNGFAVCFWTLLDRNERDTRAGLYPAALLCPLQRV